VGGAAVDHFPPSDRPDAIAAAHTRGVIEQAKGMLMLQEQCDADEAFRKPVVLAQRSRRLRFEVAQTPVASWTVGHAPT